MERKSNKERIHIADFNPDVTSLKIAHQDFFNEMQAFNAGEDYKNFNDFILDEAEEYSDAGDGATYVVWNVMYDEDEAKALGKEFDSQICGIPALEIKMFAVDEKYQDLFYEYQGEDLPISAWIMRSIVAYANELINDIVGFKAIFLHSLPDAEKFYLANEFNPMKINMQPLHGLDSEYTAMYLTLREVHMNYDK